MRYWISRFFCFVNYNHFLRRTPEIVHNNGRPYWRTNLKCSCGFKDYTVTGLVDHPLNLTSGRTWAS